MSRIELSDEESRMDGAPVGELFAVEVVPDSLLSPLPNAVELLQSLRNDYSKETSWSDQFVFVQGIRSLLLFHVDAVQSGPKDKLIQCVIDSLESLRSSSVRNGLSAGGLLMKYGNLAREQLFHIVQAMVVRTAGGPKFICDEAEAVLKESLQSINPLLAAESLIEGTHHKNADVVSKAYVLMGHTFLRIPSNTSDLCTAHRPLIKCLFIGLSSKRVQGKEGSRLAIRHLHNLIGEAEFTHAVASCDLPNSLTKLIAKEISDLKIANSSTCQNISTGVDVLDPVLVAPTTGEGELCT